MLFETQTEDKCPKRRPEGQPPKLIDEDVISQLARVLLMSRKRVESADASQLGHDDVGHHSNAFASQEETWRAIRDVLELRQSYLQSYLHCWNLRCRQNCC